MYICVSLFVHRTFEDGMIAFDRIAASMASDELIEQDVLLWIQSGAACCWLCGRAGIGVLANSAMLEGAQLCIYHARLSIFTVQVSSKHINCGMHVMCGEVVLEIQVFLLFGFVAGRHLPNPCTVQLSLAGGLQSSQHVSVGLQCACCLHGVCRVSKHANVA